MGVVYILICYLIVVNIIGFAIMGIDKRRAIKRSFRIPEATLFLFAIIGGSIGTIVGMHVFRHKTRHWYFTIGMPAILVIQIALVVLIFFSPLQITTL